MDKNCGLINLTLTNVNSERILAQIFNVNNPTSQISVGTEKLYNTSGGAGSGDQLPSDQILYSAFNPTTNIYYGILTDFGIWAYNATTDSAVLIDNSTPVNGDPLPNDLLYDITLDVTNNILYVGHAASGGGFWKYDINTNTGFNYDSSGGVSAGDNVPSLAYTLTFDSSNNILWIAGSGYTWKLDIATNTGTELTNVASGDDFAGTAISSYYDTDNDLFFVGTFSSGLYKYDPSDDSGLIYNTSGGAGSGDQLPDNDVRFQMTKKDNSLYVPTLGGGIWVYNIVTDFGSIINTSTVFNGDNLPDNEVYSCEYSSFTNKLYVGSDDKLWTLDFSTNTGTIDTSTVRPVYPSWSLIYNNGQLWDSTVGGGLYRYIEFTFPTFSSGSNEGVTYDYIIEALKSRPIKISKIIYQSNNADQLNNILKSVYESITGSKTEYTINFRNYTDPELPYLTVHIELEEGIIADVDRFLEMYIEGNTSVNFIFEYCQVETEEIIKSGIIESLNTSGTQISDENNDLSYLPISKSNIPWLLLAAAIYIGYRIVKNK